MMRLQVVRYWEATYEVTDATKLDTAGTYTYYAEAVNGTCTSERIPVTLTVNPVITPDFDTTATICSGATAPVLATVSDNEISGTWSPATVSNTQSGTYTFTPDDSQCATTATLTVTVQTTPAPTGSPLQDFTFGDTLEDLTINGTELTWYASSTGEEVLNAATTVLVSGTTYYVSQSINGCEGPRLEVTAGTDLSTRDITKNEFVYYPNPVRDRLTIDNSFTIKQITVYNMLGQLIYTKKAATATVIIDMADYASGNYIIQILSDAGMNTIKVLKITP